MLGKKIAVLSKLIGMSFMVYGLMALSLLVPMLGSGVQKVSFLVSGDHLPVLEHLRSQASHPYRLFVFNAVPADDLLDASACGTSPVKLVFEIPSYRLSDGSEINTWLNEQGIAACTGMRYTNNTTPVGASWLDKVLQAWLWPAMLSFVVCIVLAIHSRRRGAGMVQAKQMHFVLRLGVAIFSAALLYCAKSLLLGASLADPVTRQPGIEGDSLKIVPILISVGLLIPMIEETIFRAWLIPRASELFGLSGAVALSTALFAAGHWIYDPASLIFYLCAGVIFSMAWVLTRSLLVCVIGHGLYNVAVSLIG